MSESPSPVSVPAPRVVSMIFVRTEYILTVAATVCSWVANLVGDLSTGSAVKWSALSSAAYAISRGVAKHGSAR